MRFSILLTCGLAFASQAEVAAHPGGHHAEQVPWQEASEWPDRIVAAIDEDPSRSISVSWRTDGSVASTLAEIALARPDARFDLVAQSVPADTQLLDLTKAVHQGIALPVEHNKGLPPTAHHSVRFQGLEPDTLYAYRVRGAQGQWSEWFQTAPDARFILHAGDLVNRGSRDLEWAHWFRAGGFIHGMIPAIPVAGNHEYDTYDLRPDERQKLLSILWRPQFRLPEAPGLSAELQETVYEVRYSPDLHVFVLNSNMADMSEQAAWLDGRLAASDARWRIVTMHHPVYSSGRDRDNAEKREALQPVLLKHRVDLVLQGHDHTYARGTIEEAGQVPERRAATSAGRITSMFVNSVSGPKQYEFSADGWEKYAPTGVKLDRRGENTQFYQVVGIDGKELHYAAYTVDGRLYDEFRLTKGEAGEKTISASAAQLPVERSFKNTMPYEGVKD